MRRLLLILMLLPACAWPNADSTEETENLQLLYIASLPAPLPTVDFVDPARYAGVWYEIASIPQFFSQNCTCTTATYGVLASDLISVYNTCRLGSASGTLNEIAGVAYVSPATGNSILNVQFVPAFRAPYWIIALADDYSYAMVGDPYRGSLFILARGRTLADATYNALLQQATALGFDVSRVRLTAQTGCP